LVIRLLPIESSYFSGCTGLTSISSNATKPPTIQSNTFSNVNKNIPVYINCNYQNAYQSAQYWSDFTKFKIYPNPTDGEIFIKSELQIKKVEIYSSTGALLLSDNNFNGKISVSKLLKGVYIVKIYTDKSLMVKKIVKE